MLETFLSQFSTLNHLESFQFGIILSETQKTGNLLGEYILSHSVRINSKKDYTAIHPFLTPLFVKSIFGYPYDYWQQTVHTHPDFEDCQACDRIKYDKLYLCSKLWLDKGFKVPVKGADDTLEAQLENTKQLVGMSEKDFKTLTRLTQRTLYLSGLFGKTIPDKANFN